MSKTHRDKGNKLYSSRSFAAAAKEYTEAIMNAPYDQDGKSREGALALGNRSALLYETERHNDCMEDIWLALELGYPKELRYKLHDRRGRCHLAIGKDSEARSDFEEALKSLGKANLKQKKREELQKELQDAINKVRIIILLIILLLT